MDIRDKLKLIDRRLHVLKKQMEQANIYLKGVMNGKTTLPAKAWKAEYSMLTAERKILNQRYLALKDEVKKTEQIERVFTISCGRSSGNVSRAGRRIWSCKRQGGGIGLSHAALPFAPWKWGVVITIVVHCYKTF